MKIKKEEMKLPLFIDDMTGFIENPKEFTEKLLELISEFSKITLYIKSIYKNQSYFYIPAIDN